MKPNGQRKRNIAEAPDRNIVTSGTSKVKKGENRQRGPWQKATEDPGVLSSIATQVFSRQIPRSEPCITINEVTSLELKSGQVDPSTKIKLQLIPVDDATRIGLEKDGLNPFLELTLRARKRISSVIKHIHTKWGSSSIALGEPVLFPYNVQLVNPAMSRRWTLKDTGISAGDVYVAVECPAIFRLSYGWFSEHEPQVVSAATTCNNCSESEIMQKGCTENLVLTDDAKKQVERTEERKWLDVRETAEAAVAEHVDARVKMVNSPEQLISLSWSDGMTNLSIGGLLSEASLQEKISNSELKSSGNKPGLQQAISVISDISIGGLFSEASLQGVLCNNEPVSNGRNMDHRQSLIQWDDGLTALSIGGLLSEASLQAKINNSDPKSNEREVPPQPSTFMSDSFDAIIASHMKFNPQVAKSSHDSHSSILDAEETCHAFSFRKFSSSSKNVRVSVRASHDSSSISFRFPDLSEVEKQAGHAQDAPCHEPKTDILPRPQHYSEDSRSLGLRGINWNKSLGPFDLGLSILQNVSGGDGAGGTI